MVLALLAFGCTPSPQTSDGGDDGTTWEWRPVVEETSVTGSTASTADTGGEPITFVDCPFSSSPQFPATTACIRGRNSFALEVFLGVPYAEPPVGRLRWARTVPKVPETFGADGEFPPPVEVEEVGPSCVQTYGDAKAVGVGVGSEDCLTLNIMRPRGAKDQGILVHFHDGDHLNGAASDPTYVGLSLASPLIDQPFPPQIPELPEQTILITVNTRLGALGYFAHPALSAEGDGASGNQGLWDAVEALAVDQAQRSPDGRQPRQYRVAGGWCGRSAGVCVAGLPRSG